MAELKIALAGLLVVVQAPAMATSLVDGGFEAKGAALPVNAFCYDNVNAGDGFCAASPWVRLGSNSGNNTGVIRSGAGAWGGVAAAEGSYYGFIQVVGVLAQSFTADATGTGSFSWVDTSRPGYAPQSYTVSLFDGISSVTIGNFLTAAGPWVARTSSVFGLTSGTTYSLRFTGLQVVDSTAFIDSISLSANAVPEPASWAMLIAGFGLTGAAMRRRRAGIA